MLDPSYPSNTVRGHMPRIISEERTGKDMIDPQFAGGIDPWLETTDLIDVFINSNHAFWIRYNLSKCQFYDRLEN